MALHVFLLLGVFIAFPMGMEMGAPHESSSSPIPIPPLPMAINDPAESSLTLENLDTDYRAFKESPTAQVTQRLTTPRNGFQDDAFKDFIIFVMLKANISDMKNSFISCNNDRCQPEQLIKKRECKDYSQHFEILENGILDIQKMLIDVFHAIIAVALLIGLLFVIKLMIISEINECKKKARRRCPTCGANRGFPLIQFNAHV